MGVRTHTKTAFAGPFSPRISTRYVSWRPPTAVGMTMENGPWFFERFGAGWRFAAEADGTRATWKYTYTIRPGWLQPIAEPIGQRLLGREIRSRIQAFAAVCEDPVVLARFADT